MDPECVIHLNKAAYIIQPGYSFRMWFLKNSQNEKLCNLNEKKTASGNCFRRRQGNYLYHIFCYLLPDGPEEEEDRELLLLLPEELPAEPGDELRPDEDDLAEGADELRPDEDDLAEGADELRPDEDDLAAGADELRPGDDDLAAGADELRPEADDLAAGAEGLDVEAEPDLL